MTGGEATNVDRIKIQDERGLSSQIDDKWNKFVEEVNSVDPAKLLKFADLI